MVFIRRLLRDIENKISEFRTLNEEVEKITNHLVKEEEKLVKEEKRITSLVNFINIERNKLRNEFEDKSRNLERIYFDKENNIHQKEINFKGLYDDTFKSILWLSEKYADFNFLIDEKFFSRYNQNFKCVEAQKEFAKENRLLRRKNMEFELQIKYFQSLFPDFNDVTESNVVEHSNAYTDDVNIETIEKIDKLVDSNEQKKLTRSQILQIALDRYINRKKSNYAVGLDYERYIGHLYEEKGYTVEYHGIKHGFDDLGIDLICKKDKEVLLIQCKNWSQKKNIYENAINQLFGTSIKYYIDKYDDYQNTFQGSLFDEVNIPFNKDFQPIFVTTTKLSGRALEFARILKIQVLEIPYSKNYPRIKCNIGKDELGNQTKIFHLPFDQMYDKVQNIKNGGFNALTIEEAEKADYRKAFRWHGE